MTETPPTAGAPFFAHDLRRSDFGDDFAWGAATSAFQIEGATDRDGRVPSTWDSFSNLAGAIRGGDDANRACDHYDRYREDVALIRDLGLNAYRFSLSWPRIQPAVDCVNEAGLDFYDRLVDELLGAGIQPLPTLYHWDTPLWAHEAGGWMQPDVADWFASYVEAVAGRLGDRVESWATLNEPVAVTFLGHGVGLHAPGLRLGFGAIDSAVHQLRAHARAVEVLRARGRVRLGLANAHSPVRPADETPAAESGATFYDALHNRLFTDPVLLGRWPEELAPLLEKWDDELPRIAAPLDWYGVNYYHPTTVAGAGVSDGIPHGDVALPEGMPFSLVDTPGCPTSDFGWPIAPDAMTELLVGLAERYGRRLPPLLVTENGVSVHAGNNADAAYADPARTVFLAEHLAAVREAVRRGVDVRGYYHWSLLDNFEWAEGYAQRFGLVYVDFETMARTPKQSYHALRNFLADGR